MLVSVYIPTDGNRLYLLDDIIQAYNSGTVVPYEIIISAFNIVTGEQLSYIQNIYNKQYGNVKIYAGKNIGSSAENQNNAIKFTTGDIVAFHNPQHLPSVMRIEIVKNFFETYNINILHHTSYTADVFTNRTFSFDDMVIIQSDELRKRYFPFVGVKSSWMCSRTYGVEFSIQADITNICASRELLQKQKWKETYECEFYRGISEGYGYEFSMESLYTYNRSLITGSPLTYFK